MELELMSNIVKHITLLCLLISQIAISDTDPYLAPKGFSLPQESWIFSPEKAKEVRGKLIDGETYFKLNESLTKSLDLYKSNEEIQQNKVNLLLEQNDKLVKTSAASQSLNSWERVGWFVLGIAATIGAGFAIKKAGE